MVSMFGQLSPEILLYANERLSSPSSDFGSRRPVSEQEERDNSRTPYAWTQDLDTRTIDVAQLRKPASVHFLYANGRWTSDGQPVYGRRLNANSNRSMRLESRSAGTQHPTADSLDQQDDWTLRSPGAFAGPFSTENELYANERTLPPAEFASSLPESEQEGRSDQRSTSFDWSQYLVFREIYSTLGEPSPQDGGREGGKDVPQAQRAGTSTRDVLLPPAANVKLKLLNLPVEVLSYWLPFLDIASLVSCSMACRPLRDLVCHDSVWRAATGRDFRPRLAAEKAPREADGGGCIWREIFVACYRACKAEKRHCRDLLERLGAQGESELVWRVIEHVWETEPDILADHEGQVASDRLLLLAICGVFKHLQNGIHPKKVIGTYAKMPFALPAAYHGLCEFYYHTFRPKFHDFLMEQTMRLPRRLAQVVRNATSRVPVPSEEGEVGSDPRRLSTKATVRFANALADYLDNCEEERMPDHVLRHCKLFIKKMTALNPGHTAYVAAEAE